MVEATPTIAEARTSLKSFSLVVIGSMNPRLHHPTWYKGIGILDANAEQLALMDNETIVGPDGAQFRTAEYRVACLPNRWAIESEDYDVAMRFGKIAGLVFDERLRETPIQAFGINHHAHAPTTLVDVAKSIVQKLETAHLLPQDLASDTATCAIRFPWHDAGRGSLSFGPSVTSKAMLFAAFNFHYTIAQPDERQVYFSIGTLVEARLRRDFAASEEILKRTISQIER